MTSLPDDEIVLTVLRFTPISEAYSEEADNYTNRVYDILKGQSNRGTIRVKQLPVSVGLAGDEDARRDSAVALGMTRAGAAHFVLWGDLVLDEDTLTIRPRLTAVRKVKRLRVPDVEMVPLSSWDANHLIFKQWSSNRVATLVPLILGWSALLNGQPDWAIRLLLPLNTNESHLLLGRAYRLAFAQSDYPLRDPGLIYLRQAVQQYESLAPPPMGELSAASVSQTTLIAAFERAEVLHQLATFSESGTEVQRAVYLRQAVSALESLESVLERTGRHDDRKVVLLELAADLGFLSKIDALAADSLLNQSWRILDKVQHSKLSPPTPWDGVEIEGYRASILRTRALRDNGLRGYSFLQEALRRAESENLRAEARGENATLLWYNIAAASEELSIRATDKETQQRYAINAIEYYSRIAREARRHGTNFEITRDQKRLNEARNRLAPILSSKPVVSR